MLQRITLWLCLLAGIEQMALAQSRPKVFAVTDSFRSTTLLGYLSLFSDSSHRVQINDLLTNSTGQHLFRPVDREILSIGSDPRPHWIRCRISHVGHVEQQLVFGLDYVHIDALSVYVVDENRAIVYRQEGLSRKTPIADRPIAVRSFAFPITIKPGQTLTIYCRVFRRNSVLILPVNLMTRRVFVENGLSFDFLFLLGVGMLLIALLTSFALFIATKKRVLLFYSGYVFSYSIALLSLVGVWNQYVTDVAFLDENTHLVMFGIGAFTQLLFTVDFLELRHKLTSRWLTGIYALAGLAALASLYVLITPFSYANSSLISGLGLLTELVVFGLILVGLDRQRPEAVLYLIGFGPFLVCTLWFTASILFGVQRSGLFYKLGYAIPFVQLLVLGVGLGLKLLRETEQSVVAVSRLQQLQIQAVVAAQESERQRIATDLHDDLGGTLATIRQRLSAIRQRLPDSPAAQDLDALEPLIQKSGHDLRRIAHNLMPPDFARLGLRAALEQFIQSQPPQPTRFSLIVAGQMRSLPAEVELNLYRIVSELVQNIHKHAQAGRAAVQLLYHTDKLTITVEDDGLGNRSVEKPTDATGIGLKNSRLRAEYIGARLWREVSEAGTLVVLEIPYPAAMDGVAFATRRPPQSKAPTAR